MRFIAVVGIGCSGTSAVAGVLHKLGCPMGLPSHLGKHPAGFDLFEDHCFYGPIFRVRKPSRACRRELHRLVIAHRQEPIWGLKNTLLGKSLPWAIPVIAEFDEVRVIAVHRTLTASIEGRIAGRCPPGRGFKRVDAERWAVCAKGELLHALNIVQDEGLAPIYHVGFERLLKQPEESVGKIMRFAFDGLGQPSDEEFNAAVAHIDAALRHD